MLRSISYLIELYVWKLKGGEGATKIRDFLSLVGGVGSRHSIPTTEDGSNLLL